MRALASLGPGLQYVAELLLRNSLHGAALIVVIWIVCRSMHRLPASVRCALWWIASARLVVGMVWWTPIGVPLLPAAATSTQTRIDDRRSSDGLDDGSGASEASRRAVRSDLARPGAPPSASHPDRAARDVGDAQRAASSAMDASAATASMSRHQWGEIARIAASLLWVAALLAFALRGARQMTRQRRLVARARPLDPEARPIVDRLSALLGLRRTPAVVQSHEISTPQLIWIGRPIVVLPDGSLRDGCIDELEMALCHELVHLRRGDLWWGGIVAAAERLFFFHPLVRFAASEYHVNREAACDAEVVRALGAATRDYGRLLVTFGIGSRRSALAIPGASSSIVTLKRRLQMLQHVSPAGRPVSRWWHLAVAAALVGAVPIQLVARRADEMSLATLGVALASTPEESLQTPPPPPPEPRRAARVPPAPPTPAPPLASLQAEPSAPRLVAQNPPAPPSPPNPPNPPGAPEPPGPQMPPHPPMPPGHGDIRYGWHDDGDSWAFISGDGSMTMHMSSGDANRLKRLRTGKDRMFWFERGGKEYVVRDPKILDRIDAMLAPQRDLGERQGALGGKQGDLGAQQGDLGARQGELGAKQAELGARQAALGAEQARLASKRIRAERERDAEAVASEFEQKERQLHDQMDKLGAEMDVLGQQMEELGRQQETLGDQQEELGRQQEALGRQQEEMSRKVEQELRALMDEWIRSAAAEQVK